MWSRVSTLGAPETRPVVPFLSRLSYAPVRSPGERPTWRADIEGLRGVAVVLVVLYHAGVPGFTGGYVGVDVFFALSGYLITGILAAEIEATGRLDLARFYARRARRLLPAMGVLLLAVAAFAFAFYSPLEQRPIAETALATAVYVSNVHFAVDAADYSAAEVETNPLLHTWSLAVEEQFYLGWPLLVLIGLVGFRRRGPPSARRLVWTMAAVASLSFGATLGLMESLRGHWAFFASPARAWEFAVGGLGALLPRVRLGSRSPGTALGWAGLAVVVAAGMAYSDRTPFPGWAAVPVVLGTVWALRAGVGASTTSLGRLLGWGPLQLTGRLSYSWYLWHWPVLVFGAELLGHPGLPVRVALAGLSLGLAELSYRLVEDPVRHLRGLAGRPAYGLALLAAITAGSVAVSVGWGSAAAAGAARPEHVLLAETAEDRGRRECLATMRSTGLADCRLGDPEGDETVVLLGDSHAFHWLPALEAVSEERGWRLVTALKAACAPLDVTLWNAELGRPYVECDRWRERVLRWVHAVGPDLVVVSHSQANYNRLDAGEWVGATARVLRRLARTGAEVVVLRDVPKPGVDVPACLSRTLWRGGSPDDACPYDPTPLLETDAYHAQISAAGGVPNATTVDLTHAVCAAPPCPTLRDDSLVVFRDRQHLSAAFAATLAPVLSDALDAARTEGIQAEGVRAESGPVRVRTAASARR